ncbi:MAG: DUF3164 family protein [Bacteroidales bacterium]|jgi:hypothetical protein
MAKTQKVKDKVWIDEKGYKVPVDYVSQAARLREQKIGKIYRAAKSLNAALLKFKAEVQDDVDDIIAKSREEFNLNDENWKGNVQLKNFDGSIKIDVSVNERIEFDDLTINAAKEKLDEFLSENIESKIDFVREMVVDAFSTTRGKLDAKKVMGLLKYRTKIDDELFQEALNLIETSIRRPDSRTYYRFWEMDKNGEYKNIDLNFTSV